MSKALKYLSEARPEAMSAYFAFLKNNGSSLDEKTRALISIITKVANQTESGLLQYTKKALQGGVSQEEVLDALMMAFPALGLTKILWAIDILLEENVINETDGTSAKENWREIGKLDDFLDGQTSVKDVAGNPVFITRDSPAVRVFDARCPHHDSNLSHTAIRAGEVECPLHGWRFDVSTGQCVRGGRDLRERKVKIEDGVISALW